MAKDLVLGRAWKGQRVSGSLDLEGLWTPHGSSMVGPERGVIKFAWSGVHGSHAGGEGEAC